MSVTFDLLAKVLSARCSNILLFLPNIYEALARFGSPFIFSDNHTIWLQ